MATQAKKRLTDLSGEELERLLALVRSADSVELKVTLPEGTQRSAVAALGLDPLEAQIRQVFFFDTPELALNQNGLSVRARRISGRTGDTVVKLRPVVPDELPDDLRRSDSLKVEVDAMPGAYVCSASLRGKAANTEIREAVAGTRLLRKLFSKEQRAFLAAHAPEGVGFDELRVLGPIFVLKVSFAPPAFGRKAVGELWLLPDGTRILELSTKCRSDEAFEVAVETRAYLEGLGLDLEGDQQAKTRTALEFFAAELREDQSAAVEQAS
jgi:hypothetical protein